MVFNDVKSTKDTYLSLIIMIVSGARRRMCSQNPALKDSNIRTNPWTAWYVSEAIFVNSKANISCYVCWRGKCLSFVSSKSLELLRVIVNWEKMRIIVFFSSHFQEVFSENFPLNLRQCDSMNWYHCYKNSLCLIPTQNLILWSVGHYDFATKTHKNITKSII